MTITVTIPAPLRKYIENKKNIECQASSVKEAFTWLDQNCSDLAERILDQDASVRDFVKIFVNKNDIKHLQGIDTPLSSGDVISIVPAFAGG